MGTKRRRRNSMTFNSQEGNRIIADKADAELCRPSFADLPWAITVHIMLTLPIQSLLICKCVCKSWNTLISNPLFAKLHFKCAPVSVMIRTNGPKRVSRALHLLEYEPEMFHSYYCGDDFCFSDSDDSFNHECNKRIKLGPQFKLPLSDAKMVLSKRDEIKSGGRKTNYIPCQPKDDKFALGNSCNGLLCLCDPKDREPLVVCNPITGEFIRLPETVKFENMMKPIYSGFGFHQKTNDYKVIRLCGRDITHPRHLQESMYVEIHTLGTSAWRNIGCDVGVVSVLTFPTCVNGALHWLLSKGLEGSILSFNFENERFQSFNSPPNLFYYNGRNKRTEYMSMGELKGLLYICEACPHENVRMWMMKKSGIGESWSQVFSIDIDRYPWPYGLYWPLKLFKKSTAVLMYHSYNFLFYYDLKYPYKFFMVRGTRSKFEAIPHIPSLISLKEVVKGNNVEVLNVHSLCGKFKLREEKEILYLAEENPEISLDDWW